MTKVALIPIDNRPICYDLAYDILNVDSSIELFMPDIKDLGGLTTKSNIGMPSYHIYKKAVLQF